MERCVNEPPWIHDFQINRLALIATNTTELDSEEPEVTFDFNIF